MKVLAVTGASGGHIYPALGFLERLKKEIPTAEALLVLPSRSIKAGFSSVGYGIKYVTSAKLSFSLSPKSVIAFLSFIRGAWEGLLIILKFKPDVVVGFGSIDSVPLVMAAWFLRIKTIVHEQNVLPGKANRFLARFADKVAVSFPQSDRYLGSFKGKITLTGNPLRQALRRMGREEALGLLGLDKDKFTILVMGGSQGSRRINAAFLEAIGLIKTRSSLQAVHILGKEECALARESYNKLGVKAGVFNFTDSMEIVYNAADLAITRAGATTISELIYFRLPAILVPYPFAYSHQFENAKVLEEKSAGIIIRDEELTAGLLEGLIDGFIRGPERLALMRKRYEDIPGFDASGNLVKALDFLNRGVI